MKTLVVAILLVGNLCHAGLPGLTAILMKPTDRNSVELIFGSRAENFRASLSRTRWSRRQILVEMVGSEEKIVLNFSSSAEQDVFFETVQLLNRLTRVNPKLIVTYANRRRLPFRRHMLTTGSHHFRLQAARYTIYPSELKDPDLVVGFLNAVRDEPNSEEILEVPLVTFTQIAARQCFKNFPEALKIDRPESE